jgi:hypothetical protein
MNQLLEQVMDFATKLFVVAFLPPLVSSQTDMMSVHCEVCVWLNRMIHYFSLDLPASHLIELRWLLLCLFHIHTDHRP